MPARKKKTAKKASAAPRKARRICPQCASTRVRKIVYGHPSPDVIEAAERGEVILGGCCVDDTSPTWACLACGEQFGGPPPGAGPALSKFRTAAEWYDAVRGRVPLILVGHVDALMKAEGLTLEEAYRKLVGAGRIIEIPRSDGDPPPRRRK